MGGVSPSLGRASKTCYVYGSWMFIVAVVSVALWLSVYDLALSQLISLVLLTIDLPLAVLFGFYISRVGDEYDVVSLLEAGILCIVLTVASSIVVSPAFLGGGFFFFSQNLSILGPAIYFLAFLLLLVLGFVYPVTFIIGTSKMKEETGLAEFGRAMVFAIVGLLIPGFFALAVIQFGVGLSSSATHREAS